MKFKRHMELEHGLQQIDIAPLINMVFLLLIFFMLTSNFTIPPGISVNLPKAVTSELVKEEAMEILISAENLIYLNGRVTSLAEMRTIIKRIARKNPPLLIKADKRACLGMVVEIWDLCRDLGVSRINIATNQE
jgi:biopolymer transport protein ExbD